MKKLNFRLLWGLFMALIFLAMAILTLFTAYFSTMSDTLRILFGIVFLIFSFYRAYQSWNGFRS